MTFPIGSGRATRLPENFDYLVESGSTLYYGDTTGVSASNNIGSVAAGSILSRRAPSWVISAGVSNVSQKDPGRVPDATAAIPPAGGTGATAGAFSSAATRDALIDTVTKLVTDVESLRQAVKGKN